MKKVYVILKKGFEYDDNIYNEVDGGKPSLVVFDKEDADQKVYELNIQEYKEVNITDYGYGIDERLLIKAGDKIKASGNSAYLTSLSFEARKGTPLINQSTKMPEFPADGDVGINTDLFKVTLIPLRSKAGPSGMEIDIIISQDEGVLPELTEFWNIKKNDRFGLGGNDTNYYLELRPDVKLSRTKVRKKLREDKLLARACQFTSELQQLFVLEYHLEELNGFKFLPTPKELYEDIKSLGYEWDILLNSRGWHTPKQYDVKPGYLSIFDLLRMRLNKYPDVNLDKYGLDRYHPYWYDEALKGA
jgi:hypothetical protein